MKQLANSLEGKRVLVLGGSAGIGLATAKAAADRGAVLTIVGSNQDRIDGALKQLPVNATGVAVDLSSEANINHFFSAQETFDHLVYTAGENVKMMPIEDMAIKDAQLFFNIRYWGAVAAVKYGSPKMNAGGSIVLTSGISGNRPSKGWSIGASIASAMEGFARAAAVELAPIRVNIVSPGIVKTDLWNTLPEDARAGMYLHFEQTLLVKKVGEAEDIARAYIYLMEQPFSTGHTLVVDGGGVLI